MIPWINIVADCLSRSFYMALSKPQIQMVLLLKEAWLTYLDLKKDFES